MLQQKINKYVLQWYEMCIQMLRRDNVEIIREDFFTELITRQTIVGAIRAVERDSLWAVEQEWK